MFAKLFSMYPPPRDIVATAAAYIEETRDIPAIFISHALKRLRDQPVLEGNALAPRRWLPSVPEIRHESARVIRQAKLAAEGKDTREYSLRGDFQLNPERWIAEAPQIVAQLESERLKRLRGRDA